MTGYIEEGPGLEDSVGCPARQCPTDTEYNYTCMELEKGTQVGAGRGCPPPSRHRFSLSPFDLPPAPVCRYRLAPVPIPLPPPDPAVTS